MRSSPRLRRVVLRLAPVAVCLLMLFSLGGAVLQAAPATSSLADSITYTFTGNVYIDGGGAGNITVQLWGDENEWPVDGNGEVLLASGFTSQRTGAFTLSWVVTSLDYSYFHVIEVDPPNVLSVNARAGRPGYIKNWNCISYLDIPPGAYSGSAFYDERLTTPTATPTNTSIPPTLTPTSHPTQQPTGEPTARPTDQPTATPTYEAPHQTGVLVVNTTADSDDACNCLPEGDCSLREAIKLANELGCDAIQFEIPESDPGFYDDRWHIVPGTPLPPLTRAGVWIDGLTPPDGCEVGLMARGCHNATHIVLDGAGAGRGANGIELQGSGQGVSGLTLRNWSGWGLVSFGNGNSLFCSAVVDNGNGVLVMGEDCAIGAAGSGNWIAGNSQTGVQIGEDSSARNNRVQANQIGCTAYGTDFYPNGGINVLVMGTDTTVGGLVDGEGNLIVGSMTADISIQGVDGAFIDGNRIGATPNGVMNVRAIGNGNDAGVQIAESRMVFLDRNTIGGHSFGVRFFGSQESQVSLCDLGCNRTRSEIVPNNVGLEVINSHNVGVYGTVISANKSHGVIIRDASYSVRLDEMSIWDNGGKGIQLLDGANNGIQPPIIQSVVGNTVSGTACPECWVEVYSGPDDEGQWTDGVLAQADMSGNWSWTGVLPGNNITALATNSAHNTSEFSPLGLRFIGKVFQLGGSQLGEGDEPMAAVEVTLYGSDEEGALGERLTSGPSDSAGEYDLYYDPSDRAYERYTLAIVDPGVETVARVEAGDGGVATPQGWIVFEQPSLGLNLKYEWDGRQYLNNFFYIPTVLELNPNLVVALVGDDPWAKTKPADPTIQEPYDFVIDGIEVTQAIQQYGDWPGSKYQNPGQATVCSGDNCLPLVAERPALVRVYASITETCKFHSAYGPVTVDLYVTDGGATTKHSTKFKPLCWHQLMGMFNDWDQRRDYLLGSANFWVTIQNPGTAQFYAEVNMDGGWKEIDPSNNRYPATGSESVTFQKQTDLDVGYVRIDYHPKAWSSAITYGFKPFAGSSKPNASWCASSNAYGIAKGTYPVRTFNYHPLGTGVLYYGGADVRTDQASDLFAKLNKDWKALDAQGKAPDQLFAWLPDDATKGVSWDAMADAKFAGGSGRVSFSEEGAHVLLAHEIGHNYDLRHAPCPAPGSKGAPGGIDPSWPYAAAEIGDVGYDPYRGGLVDYDDEDFMSYCPIAWISPYHWKKLFPQFSAAGGSSLGSQARLMADEVVLISGMITTSGGRLDSFIPLGSALAESPPGGDYALVLCDGQGGDLRTFGFDIPLANVEVEGPIDQQSFCFAVSLPAGTQGLELRHQGAVLDAWSASEHAPVVSWELPFAGQTLWDATHFAWAAGDDDGDPLTFHIYYSPTEGGPCQLMASDLQGNEVVLDTSVWPASEGAWLKIVVCDGLRWDEAVMGPVIVPQNAPGVAIATPGDGHSHLVHHALIMDGTAWDPDQSEIPETAYSWWSDRQGLLGRGHQLVLPPNTLEAGWHEITLRVSDDSQSVGQDSIDLHVGPRVHLPLMLRP